MELTVINKDDKNFESYWMNFLQDFQVESPFYSQLWRKYQIAYSGNTLLKDISTILVDSTNTPVLICPLYLEEYDGVKQLSYRGGYLNVLRAPLFSRDISHKRRHKVETYFFELLNEYAKVYKIKKICFLIDPLCQIFEEERYNYLNKYGFFDCSMQTRIIDLQQSVEELWSKIRKSIKPMINKQYKVYKISVIDSNCDTKIIEEKHKVYKELHHKTAGRITRPLQTFDLQLEMLKNNESFMIEVLYKGRTVCINYFIHSKYSGYYASSADDPDFKAEVSTNHALQWQAIKHLKKLGAKYFELDNQYFGEQIFEHPSAKEINISIFKSAFGGKNVPIFRGIKYYDRELFKKEMNTNLELSIASFSQLN